MYVTDGILSLNQSTCSVLKIAISSHRAAVGMRALQLLARAKTQNFSGAGCSRSSMRQLTLTPLSPAAGPIWPSMAREAFAPRCRGRSRSRPACKANHCTCPPTTHATHTGIQWAYTMARDCRVQHIDPCSTLHIVTMLRVGSDLQNDSLSTSATFPAPHTHTHARTPTHVAEEGPLYRAPPLIARTEQSPPSAKVCNRWAFLRIYHISHRISREASCNPCYIPVTVCTYIIVRSFPSSARRGRPLGGGRAVPDAGSGAESGWASDIEI